MWRRCERDAERIVDVGVAIVIIDAKEASFRTIVIATTPDEQRKECESKSYMLAIPHTVAEVDIFQAIVYFI